MNPNITAALDRYIPKADTGAGKYNYSPVEKPLWLTPASGGFSANFAAQELATPAQQTAQLSSPKPAPPAAQRVARAKKAGVAGTKRSKTFEVKKSGKGKILDETKVTEKHLKSILKPTGESDVYNKYMRKLVANARTTARNSKSLKFVPILSPRTNELYIITASGQHLAFKMNNPKHLMEVASMASHAGMSTEQLSAWASNYSRGLNELDNVEGLTMSIPDANFNPSAKQDFKNLIKFNTPSQNSVAPQNSINLPQVPSVSQ